MTQVTSPKELFLHEFRDVYYAEKTLTKPCPSGGRVALRSFGPGEPAWPDP